MTFYGRAGSPQAWIPSTKRMQDTFKKTPHLPACLSLWQPVMVRIWLSGFLQSSLTIEKHFKAMVAAYVGYAWEPSPRRCKTAAKHSVLWFAVTKHQSSLSQWSINNSHYSLWSSGCSFFLDKTFFSRPPSKSSCGRNGIPSVRMLNGPRLDGSFRECQRDVKCLAERS